MDRKTADNKVMVEFLHGKCGLKPHLKMTALPKGHEQSLKELAKKRNLGEITQFAVIRQFDGCSY